MAKILFIDDDPINSKIYTSQLEALGFEVALCYGGEEALKFISDKFDLIILDIMMPRVDGVTILSEIKRGVNKGTPIIIYTNLLSEATKKECLDLGVREYLVKADYTPPVFLNIVKKYL